MSCPDCEKSRQVQDELRKQLERFKLYAIEHGQEPISHAVLLKAEVERAKSTIAVMREALEPLIETAKSYAMQTYDRHGATAKLIKAGEEALAKTEQKKGR